MSACAFLAGGRLFSAFFLVVLGGTAGLFSIRGIGKVYAENFFASYYRIPAFDRLEEALAPETLTGRLAGLSVVERTELLEYVPEGRIILISVLWILVLGVLAAYLQKKRKPENVGKVFAFHGTGLALVFLAAVAVPLWFGSLLLEVTEIPRQGAPGAAGLAAACTLLSAPVHLLAKRAVSPGGRAGVCRADTDAAVRSRVFCGKWQMLAAGILVCLAAGGFAAGAPSFDQFHPGREEVTAVRICVNGLNMSYREYKENGTGIDRYGTDRGLSQYRFTQDALAEGLAWTEMLAEGQKEKERPGYTFAAVCYEMKGGEERYRAYPVDERQLQAFSGVFETEEYKEKAYPALSCVDVGANRFTWKDGVCEQVLKMAKEEKETFFRIYKEEVKGFKMEELGTAPPVGILEMKSEKWGETQELLVYPFFERTCEYLRRSGAEAGKDLLDYPVQSLDVWSARTAGQNLPGGVMRKHYETEEELAGWRGRLVWAELDRQPLLYPLAYEEEIEIEAEDPGSGAVAEAKCYCTLRLQ